jgi:N-acetyl-gamma-glutamyl-phosphate reductase
MNQIYHTLFIDGEAGTTGLGIRDRLQDVAGIRVISIDAERRKDVLVKRDVMSQADLVVLCLPDDAAKEAVAMAARMGSDAPRIVDASTAHRVDAGWAYGFPELCAEQESLIASASHVANPGCYPSGAIALLRPLVDAGILPVDYPITINAVSGYSGGGKGMIKDYETGQAPAFELYGLGLEHKHVPEIQIYSGLVRRPVFVPSVGAFKQGMLVSIPLHLNDLEGSVKPSHLEEVLRDHYKASQLVTVHSVANEGGRIEPQALNDTDRLELRVFGHEAYGQAVLVARLDNLGKGASGAAVQNIKLMLGV